VSLQPHPSALDPQDWLTPKQVADWLHVSTKVIYRLAADDPTFPAIKVTNILRIRRSRLERWLETHKSTPPAPKRFTKPVTSSPNGHESKVETGAAL
jgi:excisionase family DNA binding protein